MMPVEEEVFINSVGEEVSISYLVDQMIQYYEMKLDNGETRVTDFMEGSEIRNLLEAFAVDLFVLLQSQEDLVQICFVETAEGEWLDKHGANPFVNLPRETGEVASGFVTFSVPEALTSEMLISAGSVVACSETGLEYELLSDVILGIGETSVSVAVESLTVGSDCNCDVGMIDTIVDDMGIAGLTVSNEEAITGGVDYEEDDDYRARLLAYIRKDDFGSLPYYTELGGNVPGVHDVSLVDVSGYTKKVLVNGTVKPTTNAVLLDVLQEFSDTNNLVIGHTFIADKPTYVVKDLTVNLTVANEIEEDILSELITVIFNGGEALEGGVGFDGLNIGEGLTRNTLYDSFYMIEDVENILIIDEETGEEITDLTVESDEALMLGEITFNQTVGV